MYVTLVELHIKEADLERFLTAVKRNHEASVREPGNLRFDVLQRQDDPTRFLLYEAYRSREDAEAHRATAHFKAWQATAPAWFASPRQATVFNGLLP